MTDFAPLCRKNQMRQSEDAIMLNHLLRIGVRSRQFSDACAECDFELHWVVFKFFNLVECETQKKTILISFLFLDLLYKLFSSILMLNHYKDCGIFEAFLLLYCNAIVWYSNI